MERFADIIENIYTAALDADAWPSALRSIQVSFRGRSAGVYAADLQRGDVSLVHLRDIDPDYVEHYVDRYLIDNPWSRVRELQLPGRVRTDTSLDEYYNEPGYYRRTEFFNEWMKPQDFTYTLGVNLSTDRHLHTKFFLYRPERAGPFSRRDLGSFLRLSRHLMNAVKVARRLGFEASRSGMALEVVDRLTFGVVFVDAEARVVHVNRFACDLLTRRDGLAIEDRALVTMHRDDAPRFVETLRAALDMNGGAAAAPGTARIRRASGQRPLSVHAFPLPRQLEQPFARPDVAAVVVVTDPELEAVVPLDELQRRYGLSAAEARLAQCLAQGAGLRDAAQAAGVTYETARWYLKSAFQKTRTTRQADLVRLLLSDRLAIGAS